MISANAVFVVTRPSPDQTGLMEALASQGRIAIHNPGFRLESEPEGHLVQLLHRLSSFDLVIVTSPTAARLVAANMNPGPIESVRFVAPGPGTGAILESAGIPVIWPETGGTSEHVLATAAENIVPERVAIVGAPGGRKLLAREFSRRGAQVVPFHLYRRVPVAPNPDLVDGLKKGVELVNFLSSRQAFDTILAGLPQTLRSVWLASAFVVSSARLAAIIREAGAKRVRIADGASDEAMLAAASLEGGG